MRRFSATLCALLILAVAAPAAAQIAGRRDYPSEPPRSLFLPDSRSPGPGIWAEIRHLRGRIDRAHDAGLISRREARRLDREARRIGHAAVRYARDGLSASERAELDARSAAVRSAIVRPAG